MDKEKLNTLAVKSASGCQKSTDAILQHFIPIVRRMSQSIWYLLIDETSFEHECYYRIKLAARKYDPLGGRSFSNYVVYNLTLVRKMHLKRREIGRDKLTSIEALASRDDDATPYEVIDNLAVIDDRYLVNEKIALLAEDDSRKLAILNAWSNGEYNDSDTASFLAKRCGGNSESHRKFINRFRTTCQKALA